VGRSIMAICKNRTMTNMRIQRILSKRRMKRRRKLRTPRMRRVRSQKKIKEYIWE
jgi:hypothetical protein